MKIGEVIARVQSLYSKGVSSDDSRLSDKHIYNKLLTVRSKLLIEDDRKYRTADELVTQSLYVDLVKSKQLPCGGLTKCTSMISKNEIPVFISNSKTNLLDVYSENMLIHFNRITQMDVRRLAGSRYGRKAEYYFFDERKLVVLNSKIKRLIIDTIWEDPIKIYRLTEECLGLPYVDNKEIDFYTPANLIDTIVGFTTEELIANFMKMKEDENNNSNED